MLTGRYLQGTQHVVHAAQLGRLAVDGGRPAGIVDFREHHDTAHSRLHVVVELVGFVGRQLHDAHGVLVPGLSQHVAKRLVGHGYMAQVYARECVNLLIGIVHVAHLVH